MIAGLLARKPWPAPNQAPDDAGNNLQRDDAVLEPTCDNLIVKIDHHFAQSDLLTLRYFYGTATRAFRWRSGSAAACPGFNTVTPTTVQPRSRPRYTHVVSPKLLFELRGGYNRFDETFFPEDNGLRPELDRPRHGRATRRTSGCRRSAVGDYATLGANTSLPRGRVDTNWQGFGNVSYNAGRHS